MGFRSTFAVEDICIEWPEWFIAKYSDVFWFSDHGYFAPKFEQKTYGALSNLYKDIQAAINWGDGIEKFVLAYLHECGGITRFQIEENRIIISEPSKWDVVDAVRHHYCYRCSDVE